MAVLTINIAACGKGKKTKTYDASNYSGDMTVDVFDSFANYDGFQSGWFADEVYKRFRLKLNMISPNLKADGSSMMEIRAAAGNIGDLVIFSGENEKLQSFVKRGLLADISDYVDNTVLMDKYGKAVEYMNDGLDGIYAAPGNISTMSADTPQDVLEPSFAPYVRWDYYKELGYPEVGTLEELLPIFKEMQENHPYSDSGEKTYAFSFFPDWDGNLMLVAKQPCCFYGYDEHGFLLVSADGSDVYDFLAEDSPYMRVLKFYNKAYRMGLVDPQSKNNSYQDVYEKYEDGAIFYSPWPFLGQSAYNTAFHTSQGKGFMPLDIADMKIYENGCLPFGDPKKLIAVGSRAKDVERLADFITFLYTDEGVYSNEANTDGGSAGPLGMCWQLSENGPELTTYGERTLIKKENVEVPKDASTGTFRDGMSQLNFNTVNFKEPDSKGNPYSYYLWDSVQKYSYSPLLTDWQEHMDAKNTMDYLTKNNKFAIHPGSSDLSKGEPNEIVEMRDAVKSKLVNYSWKMVFASSVDTFNEYYEKAVRECKRFGYDEVCEYDRESLTDE